MTGEEAFGGGRVIPDGSDGASVLDAVEDFLCTFVCFPSHGAAVAATLWAVHCHTVHSFVSTPRLAVLSPEPGSGKTRLLEVLELLVPSPLSVLSASVAAIFRVIEAESPTLLLDEVDAVFHNKSSDSSEDLRALLNAGHRQGAKIPRCVGKNHEVHLFPVYAPVAMAGLGDLPDTLMSRSVIIRMRRRAPGELVEPFRRREAEPDGTLLRESLDRWGKSVADGLAAAYPLMPNGVTDRPADVWEPLLAVADAAGGRWPECARDACRELVKVAESREVSLGVRLLADVRIVMAGVRHLATEELLSGLWKLDEAPWSNLRGSPLDPRGLARLLKGYGVGATKIKADDGRSVRGYRREDLWDPWCRYLTPLPTDPELMEPPEPPRSDTVDPVPPPSWVPEPSTGPEPAARRVTSSVPEVPDVPHAAALTRGGRSLADARSRARADGIADDDPLPDHYLTSHCERTD